MGLYLLAAVAGGAATLTGIYTLKSWLKLAYHKGYCKGYENGSRKEHELNEARLEILRKTLETKPKMRPEPRLHIMGAVNQDGTVGRVVGEA